MNPWSKNSSVIEPCSKKRTTLYYEDTDMQSVLETSRFSMWQFNESEKTIGFDRELASNFSEFHGWALNDDAFGFDDLG